MPQKSRTRRSWIAVDAECRSSFEKVMVDQVVKLCYRLTRVLDDVAQVPTTL